MPCEILQEAGTTFFVLCSRRGRKLCRFCRKFYATKLCDAPRGNGRTCCDAPICPSCATNAGPDTDYCPDHRNQQSLFGGTQ
jgi:hypothetical protein